ncbi:hypothetical protein MUG94_13375 [Arthrobacter gengyunqii]|uniref:Uncharacterized protein n=1 Tax=Arthrobacter gengyunqii TaxID=2886940 RepID=A0A9X1S5J2_9MICC|nr:hypothetical protein [Arthrobacter gengyunqii]MCC3268106.1 hypothetical protein [Arthrobacter gengyunqii]UOY95523.1 hypothetical protein MUG94_13375 [Arthrobacter gengyunqii]
MDFPLNSSLILAVTVGLWLLWVAPYLFRLSDTVPVSAVSRPAARPAPSSTAIRSSISADGLSQQGKTMYNESTSQHASAVRSGTAAPGTRAAGVSGRPQSPQQGFRIRYGRTALALAGALALLMVVLGLPLAVFGAVSWWMPLGGAAVAGAAIASLRVLAVRDRRHRVDAAFRAAMSAGIRQVPVSAPEPAAEQPAAAAEPVRPQRETVLFDAQSFPGAKNGSAETADEAVGKATVTTAPGSSDRPLTAAELRSAALEFAAASTPQAPAGPPKTSTTPWEPVAVPKPVYVEAPVAQRPAPEPLVPPQTPKPAARTSLRAGAAAAAAESSDSTGSDAAPGTGKINLDDVLQRRRA